MTTKTFHVFAHGRQMPIACPPANGPRNVCVFGDPVVRGVRLKLMGAHFAQISGFGQFRAFEAELVVLTPQHVRDR